MVRAQDNTRSRVVDSIRVEVEKKKSDEVVVRKTKPNGGGRVSSGGEDGSSLGGGRERTDRCDVMSGGLEAAGAGGLIDCLLACLNESERAPLTQT